MSKYIILLDVDGVLADFVGAVRGICAELDHDLVVNTFDFTKQLQLQHPLAYQHYLERSAERGFCYGMQRYRGAVQFLKQLRKLGDVVAVTATLKHCPTWSHERKQWLADLGFQQQDIIFAVRKDLVVGDFFVDDKLSNLETWNNRWQGAHSDGIIRSVLVGHGYNVEHQPVASGDWYARVEHNFDDIVRFVAKAIERGAVPITGRDFH